MKTKDAIEAGVENTQKALNRLPPAEVEKIREMVMEEMRLFVENEWLRCNKPEDK